MKSLLGLVLLLGGAAALLSACGSPSSKYRQKMVVEIETPSGLKTGYSVVEVGNSAPPGGLLKGIPGNGFSVRGEAVAVEVASGKTLFALLSSPPERGSDNAWYQSDLIGAALRSGAKGEPPLTLPSDDNSVETHRAIGSSRVKVVLPEKLYPLLVTFGDLSDPKTVTRVDPANLAASFGAGVRLTRITVEVTDEPMTDRLDSRLAQMGIEFDRGLDRTKGVTATPTLAQRLGYKDFKRKPR